MFDPFVSYSRLVSAKAFTERSHQSADTLRDAQSVKGKRLSAVMNTVMRDAYAGAAVGSRIGAQARWITGDGPGVAFMKVVNLRDKVQTPFDDNYFGAANGLLWTALLPTGVPALAAYGCFGEVGAVTMLLPGFFIASGISAVVGTLGMAVQTAGCLMGAAVGAACGCAAGVVEFFTYESGAKQQTARKIRTEHQAQEQAAKALAQAQRRQQLAAQELAERARVETQRQGLDTVVKHLVMTSETPGLDGSTLATLAATSRSLRTTIDELTPAAWQKVYGLDIPHRLPDNTMTVRQLVVDRTGRAQRLSAIPVNLSAAAQQKTEAFLARGAVDRAQEHLNQGGSCEDALVILSRAKEALTGPAAKAVLVRALAKRPIEACYIQSLDPNNLYEGYLELARAWQQGWPGVLGLMTQAGVAVDSLHPTTHMSSAHQACIDGDADSLAVLLEAGANPLLQTGDHATCLHLAARGADPACLRLVLDRVRQNGGDIAQSSDQRTLNGESVLRIAVRHGSAACTELLLAQGARINDAAERAAHRKPLLTLAVELNKIEQVKALIDGGAEVNRPSNVAEAGPLETALTAALQNWAGGKDVLLHTLLQAGAVLSEGPQGFNALNLVLRSPANTYGRRDDGLTIRQRELEALLLTYAPDSLIQGHIVALRGACGYYGRGEISPVLKARNLHVHQWSPTQREAFTYFVGVASRRP